MLRCRSACVFGVLLVGTWCGSSEAQFNEGRDYGPSETTPSMMREHIADFLLELMQGHGFASKARDEIAHWLGARAKAQAAQQVEQLFEHSPLPHSSRESAGRIASSLSPRVTVL